MVGYANGGEVTVGVEREFVATGSAVGVGEYGGSADCDGGEASDAAAECK